MRINKIIYVMLLALLVSACGSAPTAPSINPEDVQNTAIAAAMTIVVQTQAAVPTDTLVPPTETSTETPIPTNTLESSPTAETLAPFTPLPSDTPQPTEAGNNQCNQPLTQWQGPTVSFAIVNETKPQGKILLLMSVLTPQGECGWLNIYSDSFSGPVGSYSAGAFVNGPKNFKVFGAFQINEGSWKVIVRNDTIVAKGSCYPRC